jgi:demethylmenaquinone methyltransferase/2-methoxy-6-polyprenyl-1,4-benzoquinol methylase
VLELACGTGIWTEKLLPLASGVTALDGAAETLALNARRLRSSRVRYIEADLFQWRPGECFDTVFFGFWLSHVPPDRFAEFWRLVRSCLAPGGRVFFIDSRPEQTSSAIDQQSPEPETVQQRRRLNDGREFQIYKIYYNPDRLTERLRTLGWCFDIRQSERYFIYGSGRLQNA